MEIIKKLIECDKDRKNCVMATVVSKQGKSPVYIGSKIILTEDNERYGTVGGGDVERIILDKCSEVLKDGKNIMVTYDLTGGANIENSVVIPMICGGVIKVYFENFKPKPEVAIFGAGHVGREICKKLENTGFKVNIIDNIKPEEKIYDEFFENFESFVDKDMLEGTFAVICTGTHETDYAILKSIVTSKKKLNYLGMLASPKKAKTLAKNLLQETGLEVEKFYSPIGLEIGGDTPGEIAISIVAQIQMVRYSKK